LETVDVVDCSFLFCFSKHNKAAVQIKEDMKRMVQLPMIKASPATATAGKKIFGVSLLELRGLGLVKDGVPVVVRSMVEYLEKHGLHLEGLFRVNGSVRTVDNLRQRFDGGEEVDLHQDADACAVASLLKRFLRDLPEGLIHPSIHSPLIQLYQGESDVRELLLQLPDIHYSLLHYLCHFLSQVEQEHTHNRMTATNLATVFGPNVFHVSSGFDGIREQNICNNIMAKLIQNYSAIFEPVVERKLIEEKPSNLIIVKVTNMLSNIEWCYGVQLISLHYSNENVCLHNLSTKLMLSNPTPGSTKTIRSAVEQHLFNSHMPTGQSSEGLRPTAHSSSPVTTARARRRHLREQEENFSAAEPCDDVPRLDLSTLTDDNNWAEPVPSYSSWQRESMDREEARLSPHAGGKLIRQLLEEDSNPMVSPRFYAYGDGQQYLDDTEVPPSPPNAHSFVSRRRSSSLGSCDDDREELTSAQLSKRIHVLKKKIRRFEEKFEEEHKYRPSHSDKAANPEVLRWMNELAKMRKDLKDHKLLKSEEDLTPIPRQRSNTLPKSFGSQLEKKPTETKAPKPPVESTLEAVMDKLQEKRKEAGRPEDVKDMTREQIGAEKVALQKALLYYESIHGRPITKNERQVMKPLYDRYRLIKQILCRASAIPVIGSPSSKRRGPLLQPIIEGVPALFFSDTKEEEDGSDDDNDTRTQFTVTVKPELSMLGLLDQLDEDTDGFISPVDEFSPSKNTTDMRLSNLHAATMQELVEQLQEAREEKKRIRKNLRDFEDQFFKQNGRNVQKEDRSPLAGEYNEYKHIKAKLRLLEVLISKRDSSKFI
uniref:Family with sequence similarity 13 member A n=1 Tax=Sinocyclocheilus grahami TaxID=75366 RepID=A0A672KJ96_SINGR